MLTQPVGYIIIWVQVDRVQAMMRIWLALLIPDLSNFMALGPCVPGNHMISCIMNVIRKSEIDALTTPWVNAWVVYLLVVRQATTTVGDDKVTTKVLDPVEHDEIVPPRIVR